MTVTRQRTRTLVALNGDVVGYSRLMADDPDATSASMGDTVSLVERVIRERGGTLVNFVGDNFMATFEAAIDATRAAIEITTTLEERNADVPANRRLRFRMGMDEGPVAVVGDRHEGETLNIAARIQALAPAGGLSVSGRVYRALDEPELRFHPTGPQQLKGIPEPLEVYEFVDLPTGGSGLSTTSALALESPTVAVLPVHADDADDTVRQAAGMLGSDLVHRLSAIPELNVIDAASRAEAGPDHAARYVVETNTHQVGDSVRIFVAVIDVTTWNIVKSHKATTTVDGLLDSIDRLVEDVAAVIEVELVVGAPAGIYADLGDPKAIEKVYLGWFHLTSETREGWMRARELFGEVAEAHPDQTYGHVLSAFANWIGATYRLAPDPASALEKAGEQAQRGLEIGDPTGLAQAVHASVLMSTGRVDDAVEAMEHLDIRRPTCDVTYGLEGSMRRYLGQWEEAVDLLDVAMKLTGVNKPWYPTVKACSLFIGNRLEQAASMAEAVLEHQPRNLEAMLVLAAAQVELGLERRAAATADRIRTTHPNVDVGEWVEQSPYQDPAIIDRWKADLARVGLVATDS